VSEFIFTTTKRGVSKVHNGHVYFQVLRLSLVFLLQRASIFGNTCVSLGTVKSELFLLRLTFCTITDVSATSPLCLNPDRAAVTRSPHCVCFQASHVAVLLPGDAIIANETLALSVMHDWLETSEFDAELEGTRAHMVVYMYRNTNILNQSLSKWLASFSGSI